MTSRRRMRRMRLISAISARAHPQRMDPQARTQARTHGPRQVFASAGVLVVFLAALGLAACGASSTPTAGGGNCGTVHSAAGGAFTTGTAATVDCFWQAYSHCQSASLTFGEMGVDTANTHTFTIQPGSNSGCAVKDSVSFFQASGGFHSTRTYQCAGVRQSSGGLVIEQCGAEGSVVIPAPNGTPAPTSAP